MNAMTDLTDALRRRIAQAPLEDLDPSDADLFETDTVGLVFDRLRREDPVHRSRSPHFGEYWSVTRYQDIMAVDTNHKVYSSRWDLGGIAIVALANLSRLEPLIRERTRRVLDELPRGGPSTGSSACRSN